MYARASWPIPSLVGQDKSVPARKKKTGKKYIELGHPTPPSLLLLVGGLAADGQPFGGASLEGQYHTGLSLVADQRPRALETLDAGGSIRLNQTRPSTPSRLNEGEEGFRTENLTLLKYPCQDSC